MLPGVHLGHRLAERRGVGAVPAEGPCLRAEEFLVQLGQVLAPDPVAVDGELQVAHALARGEVFGPPPL
eukprot:3329778-Pyramimonas_sp.AAC.1